MTKNDALTSYAHSFCWIIGFAAAAAVGVIVGASSFQFYFVRSAWDRFGGIVVFAVIAMVIAGVAAVLVFAASQIFEAMLAGLLTVRRGDRAHFLVLLALPLSAILTCYSIDYLIPSLEYIPFDSSEAVPYHHGLTFQRYALALMFQVPVTLFNALYFESAGRHLLRKVLVAIALATAAATGAAYPFLLR